MEGTGIEIPYAPRYPHVHETLERTRFVALVAHRRFGKTVLSVNHLIKAALLCRRERGSFAYVGPFRNQAKAVAWDYLKTYSAPLPGLRVNEGELSIALPNGARLRIFGADNPDALRGLYFDGVVLDEVADMRPDVWEKIVRPALSDRRGWALFIGTPKGVNLFSELYYRAVSRQAAGDTDWAALRFPVTETGALPPDEVAAARAEMSERAFRQEYLCDFAASADDVLVTLDEAGEAMRRRADSDAVSAWPLVMGVDVARFGGDATVFFRRRGPLAYPPEVMRGLATTEVAQRLMAAIAEYRPAFVCVDQGQGAGVIDLTRELCRFREDTSIVEVPFGSRALKPDRYVNRRAEMWASVRDWLRAGGVLPENEALLAELTAPTYDYDAAGRLCLEAKEAVKGRLRRSTDLADALALTFAVRVGPGYAPRRAHPAGRGPGYARHDGGGSRRKAGYERYNPFS